VKKGKSEKVIIEFRQPNFFTFSLFHFYPFSLSLAYF